MLFLYTLIYKPPIHLSCGTWFCKLHFLDIGSNFFRIKYDIYKIAHLKIKYRNIEFSYCRFYLLLGRNRHPSFYPFLIWFIVLKSWTTMEYLNLSTPPLHVLADFKMPQFPFRKLLCHMWKPPSSGIYEPLLIIDHNKWKKSKFPQGSNPKYILLYTAPVICQYIHSAMPLRF